MTRRLRWLFGAGPPAYRVTLLRSAAAIAMGVPGLALAAPASSGAAAAPPSEADARATGATTDSIPEDNGGGVQDIIVTAQKRSEPLQRVPVSVQVVQGDALQATNRNSLEDIGQTLPAVHLVNSGSVGNTLNIRGIGSGNSNPAFDQSVATFVDGIYYGRSVMLQSAFLDLDRIEVLKGPQSTFFGNSAIAGALNIVTRKPGDRTDGYARALYGSFGQFALEGATTILAGKTLSFRFAGTFNGQNGWITNTTTGQKVPHERNIAGRGTAVWTPSSSFDATLKVEASSNRMTGTATDTPYQLTNCPPPSPLAVNAILRYCSADLASPGYPFGLNNNLNEGLAGQFGHLRTDAEVLTMNYHLGSGDGPTITSVSGRYGYNYLSHVDNAGTGATVNSTRGFGERFHQVSQELRLVSPTGRPIEYLAGVYYQNDTFDETLDGNAAFLTPSLPAFQKGGLITAAQLAQLQASLPIGYTVATHQRERIYAAFGALSFNVTDQLKFNLGLRGTQVKKGFTGNILYGQATQVYGGIAPYPASLQSALGFLLGAPGSYPYARKDSALVGSAGAQYQITPTAMWYFTFSRGFKAGGFNAISPGYVGGTLAPTFGPEHVNSYETGLKSKLLNNHVLLNVDVFREDYSGLQVNSLIQLTANNTIAVQNAANSRSQGVELETQLVFSPRFRLFGDITYLDAHYVSFPHAAPTFLQKQNKLTSQDLSGRRTDFAPEWSGSVTAEANVEFSGDYRLTASLTPFFETSYYNSVGTDDPVLLIPGHVRLDGRITLEKLSNRVAIDLIGKNLTDRVIPVSFGSSTALGGKEPPRSIAIQLRYRW